MFKKIWTLGLALVILVGCAACSPQKKPEDNAGRLTPGSTAQDPAGRSLPEDLTAPAPNRPLPTAPNEVNSLAENLAARGAAVPGVKSCTVVLTGSTAMVGIETDANLEKGNAEKLKKDVANTIKKADSRVKNVLVSTDPNAVTRIKKIARGIKDGKPITTFNTEVAELLKRLTPTTR